MPEKEFCDIVPLGGENRLAEWLKHVKPCKVSQKYGIKCPAMIRKSQSIENTMKLSDSTRLVIGVRHPVLWFESFYSYRSVFEVSCSDAYFIFLTQTPFTVNFRVKENYDHNRSPSLIVPPLETTGTNHWNDCSTVLAQFDLYLKQLGKTPLSTGDVLQMEKSSYDPKTNVKNYYFEKRVSPNPFKVFIYTPEQLGDRNATRQEKFCTDLQRFLRLDSPISPFDDAPRVNSNEETHPEIQSLQASRTLYWKPEEEAASGSSRNLSNLRMWL
jgi:hypothetical protein